jgi:hypothetical protein
MSKELCTVNISSMDAIDALTHLLGSILAHMAAGSPTFIDTLRANVESADGLSEASKNFAKQVIEASEVSVKMFTGKTDC